MEETERNTELLEKITDVIHMFRPSDETQISSDTAISFLGFDSLGLVNLLLEIEEKFDISINLAEHEFPPSFSVGNIADMVMKLQEQALGEKGFQEVVPKKTSLTERDDER